MSRMSASTNSDSDERRTVLIRNYSMLRRRYPKVLSFNVGTKWVGGVDTGRPCITVFVSKKIPKSYLSSDELLPSEVDGIPVDVIELSSEDYRLGETGIGRKNPELQRRIAGGVKKR